MKIAIIIRSLVRSGGGERQALMLARELLKMGHDVKLFTYSFNRETCFPEVSNDLPIISSEDSEFTVPTPSGVFSWIRQYRRENRMARRLADLIPNDVQVLNPHDEQSSRATRYYKKMNSLARSVLMLNDLHIARWSLFDDQVFSPRRKTFVEKVRSCIKDFFVNRASFAPQDRIAVLNNGTVPYVRKYLNREAVVVRSGVSLEDFPYTTRSPIAAPKIRLLSQGIFYIHRRFEDTIRAVALLRRDGFEASLDIVGEYAHKDTAESYYTKLVHLTHELGIADAVHFYGKVSDAEFKKKLLTSDIFIFPNHRQTWGLVVFEAMATGLPVIISKTAGASEILKDELYALIIPPLSPESIRGAVIRLVRDKNLYMSLSKEGADFVRGNVSWQNYASEMLAIFEGKEKT